MFMRIKSKHNTSIYYIYTEFCGTVVKMQYVLPSSALSSFKLLLLKLTSFNCWTLVFDSKLVISLRSVIVTVIYIRIYTYTSTNSVLRFLSWTFSSSHYLRRRVVLDKKQSPDRQYWNSGTSCRFFAWHFDFILTASQVINTTVNITVQKITVLYSHWYYVRTVRTMYNPCAVSGKLYCTVYSMI